MEYDLVIEYSSTATSSAPSHSRIDGGFLPLSGGAGVGEVVHEHHVALACLG